MIGLWHNKWILVGNIWNCARCTLRLHWKQMGDSWIYLCTDNHVLKLFVQSSNALNSRCIELLTKIMLHSYHVLTFWNVEYRMLSVVQSPSRMRLIWGKWSHCYLLTTTWNSPNPLFLKVNFNRYQWMIVDLKHFEIRWFFLVHPVFK